MGRGRPTYIDCCEEAKRWEPDSDRSIIAQVGQLRSSILTILGKLLTEPGVNCGSEKSGDHSR